MILYEPYPRSEEEIIAWYKSERRKRIELIYINNKQYLEEINDYEFTKNQTNEQRGVG